MSDKIYHPYEDEMTIQDRSSCCSCWLLGIWVNLDLNPDLPVSPEACSLTAKPFQASAPEKMRNLTPRVCELWVHPGQSLGHSQSSINLASFPSPLLLWTKELMFVWQDLFLGNSLRLPYNCSVFSAPAERPWILFWACLCKGSKLFLETSYNYS